MGERGGERGGRGGERRGEEGEREETINSREKLIGHPQRHSDPGWVPHPSGAWDSTTANRNTPPGLVSIF